MDLKKYMDNCCGMMSMINVKVGVVCWKWVWFLCELDLHSVDCNKGGLCVSQSKVEDYYRECISYIDTVRAYYYRLSFLSVESH